MSKGRATKGQSLTEYGLVIGLIVILAIAALTQIGKAVDGSYRNFTQELNDAQVSGGTEG